MLTASVLDPTMPQSFLFWNTFKYVLTLKKKTACLNQWRLVGFNRGGAGARIIIWLMRKSSMSFHSSQPLATFV